MRLADEDDGEPAWLKGPVAAFRGLERLDIVLEPAEAEGRPHLDGR
jgi:hypothetical protein